MNYGNCEVVINSYLGSSDWISIGFSIFYDLGGLKVSLILLTSSLIEDSFLGDDSFIGISTFCSSVSVI